MRTRGSRYSVYVSADAMHVHDFASKVFELQRWGAYSIAPCGCHGRIGHGRTARGVDRLNGNAWRRNDVNARLVPGCARLLLRRGSYTSPALTSVALWPLLKHCEGQFRPHSCQTSVCT